MEILQIPKYEHHNHDQSQYEHEPLKKIKTEAPTSTTDTDTICDLHWRQSSSAAGILIGGMMEVQNQARNSENSGSLWKKKISDKLKQIRTTTTTSTSTTTTTTTAINPTKKNIKALEDLINELSWEMDVKSGLIDEERVHLKNEREAMGIEREHLKKERETMGIEREHIKKEREAIKIEREHLKEERNVLSEERQVLKIEREAIKTKEEHYSILLNSGSEGSGQEHEQGSNK